MSYGVLLFQTQTVWLMEMPEMVLPEEHVHNITCVKLVEHVHTCSQVHCTNYLLVATFSVKVGFLLHNSINDSLKKFRMWRDRQESKRNIV